jgi:hypothetical protein
MSDQQLVLPNGAREIILSAADGLLPVERAKFLSAMIDQLQGRTLTNGEIVCLVSVVRRRMLGLAASQLDV